MLNGSHGKVRDFANSTPMLTLSRLSVPACLGLVSWMLVTLLHVQDAVGVYGENIKNIEGRIVRANQRMDDLEMRMRPLEKNLIELNCVTRPLTCR